jgi:zona occludens toxin (predicted ATPase)
MPLLTTSNRSSVFSAFLATAPFLLHQYKVGKKVIKGGEYAWSVANNLKYRQDVSRLFKVVGTKPDVGFMTVISASIDAAKAGGHLADHQYGAAAWDVWHTTEDVGSAIPVIGWSLTAYKFGNEIGYGLDHQFHVSDHSSDSIQQDAVASLYQGRRTEQLTVAEATQYAHRYDGVSGAGHFAQDFAGSSIKSAKRILGGGW